MSDDILQHANKILEKYNSDTKVSKKDVFV